MKERVLLFLIIACLTLFVFWFQSYTDWGLAFLIAAMALYAVGSTIAYKIKNRKLLKNPLVINKNYKPFVSVLIPAHNEESVISNTVENILSMDYENFEVIVIDDRSTDNTASVIKDLELKHANVKTLIREKEAFPGKSAVLNDALKLAKGEAILVFDADATVNTDFLSKLIPILEPKDVGAVQARKVIRNKDVNYLTRCQNNEYTMDMHCQLGRDAVKGAVELRGNGELIKREAIDDIGGWNNYTITDDLDMSTRLHIKGWDIRFCPDVIVYEEGVIYLFPLFKQRRRWLEGTIRRYLEYFGDVLTSKKMSLRASLDMTAYISEFIMPAWFLIEIVIVAYKFLVKDASPHIWFSSIIIGAIIGIGFVLTARYALRYYDHMNRVDAFLQAVGTSVYLFVIWFPLVLLIGFKILFMKKDMNWGKTTHGLVQNEHALIKARENLKLAQQKAEENLRLAKEKAEETLRTARNMAEENLHAAKDKIKIILKNR